MGLYSTSVFEGFFLSFKALGLKRYFFPLIEMLIHLSSGFLELFLLLLVISISSCILINLFSYICLCSLDYCILFIF